MKIWQPESQTNTVDSTALATDTILCLTSHKTQHSISVGVQVFAKLLVGYSSYCTGLSSDLNTAPNRVAYSEVSTHAYWMLVWQCRSAWYLEQIYGILITFFKFQNKCVFFPCPAVVYYAEKVEERTLVLDWFLRKVVCTLHTPFSSFLGDLMESTDRLADGKRRKERLGDQVSFQWQSQCIIMLKKQNRNTVLFHINSQQKRWDFV